MTSAGKNSMVGVDFGFPGDSPDGVSGELAPEMRTNISAKLLLRLVYE